MIRPARRSAANAVKHGYAAIYHVRKEDEPQLRAICRTLVQAWQPIGHRETDLVNRLSVATLTRTRIEDEMQIRLERETRNAPLYHARQGEAEARKIFATLRRNPVAGSNMLFESYYGARLACYYWLCLQEHLEDRNCYSAGLSLIIKIISIMGSFTDIERINETGRNLLMCHLKLSGKSVSEIREFIARGMPKNKHLTPYQDALISRYANQAEQTVEAYEQLRELVDDAAKTWSDRVDELESLNAADLQDFIDTEAGRGLGDPQLIKQFQLQERYYARAVNEIRKIEMELTQNQFRRGALPSTLLPTHPAEFFPESASVSATPNIPIKIMPEPSLDIVATTNETAENGENREKISIIENTPTQPPVVPVSTTQEPLPGPARRRVERVNCNLVDDSGQLRLRQRFRLDRGRVNELMALIRSGTDPFMDFFDTAMIYVAIPHDKEAFADLSFDDRRAFESLISDAINDMMMQLQNKIERYMQKEDKAYEELFLLAQWGLISVEQYNAEVAKLDRMAM